MTKNKLLLSTIGALVAVSLTAFAICGCAQPTAATPPAEDFTAPNMGTPADLVATNGTAPATEADAIKLYNDVCFKIFMQLDQSDEEFKASKAKPIEVKEPKGPKDLNREVTVGNGKAKITGKLVPSSTRTKPETLTAKTRYDGCLIRSITGDSAISLEGVTFTDAKNVTYTISGKATNKIDQYINQDMLTGTDLVNMSDATTFTDIRYKRTYGMAFSVKASDGTGAKFIVSTSVTCEIKESATTEKEFYTAPLLEAIKDENATLRIYDDEGILKHEISIPYQSLVDIIDMNDMCLDMKS